MKGIAQSPAQWFGFGRDWSDGITAPMHRSAKLQTPPNAVDLL